MPQALANTTKSSQIIGQYKGVFHSHEVIMALDLAADKKYYWAFTTGALDATSQGTWTISNNVISLLPNPNEPSLPPELVTEDISISSGSIPNKFTVKIDNSEIDSKIKLSEVVLVDGDYVEITSKKLNNSNTVEFSNIGQLKDLFAVMLSYSYDNVDQGQYFSLEPNTKEVKFKFVDSENQLIHLKLRN